MLTNQRERALTSLGRRALSPRTERALRTAIGEPVLQINHDQNPQPTGQSGPGFADQQVTMLSIPAGGPGEGQRYISYQQQPQPQTSDAESRLGSTQTCEKTPIGDEEPMGLMSDTDPSTATSGEPQS